MEKHKGTGKTVSYHSKHGAWVIHRPIVEVHTTGGSWFEHYRFATLDEAIKHLDTEHRNNEERKCQIG